MSGGSTRSVWRLEEAHLAHTGLSNGFLQGGGRVPQNISPLLSDYVLLLIYLTLIYPQYFLDITDDSGAGYYCPLNVEYGAGATFVDIDQDGWEDLLIPTASGEKILLLKNC